MKAYFKFSTLLITVLLFILTGCSKTTQSDRDNHIKTTFKVLGSSGSFGTSSIKTQSVGDNLEKLELFIDSFIIGSDDGPGGLHFIGNDVHIADSKTPGRWESNAGWYDVTEPSSLTVINQIHPGQYSAMGLQIKKVRGSINGVDFETSGNINPDAAYKDWAWILYTNGNDFVPPVFGWGRGDDRYAEFVSWNPIVIQNNHKELIATLEMDIANILKPGTTQLIDKWRERIKITTELR